MANPLEFNNNYFRPVLNNDGNVGFAPAIQNNFKQNIKTTCNRINDFLDDNPQILIAKDKVIDQDTVKANAKTIGNMIQRMNTEVNIKNLHTKTKEALRKQLTALNDRLIPPEKTPEEKKELPVEPPEEEAPPTSPLLQRQNAKVKPNNR
jgi:hypothetical protein